MPQTCVIPYCSVAIPSETESSNAEMIMHLLTAHGWTVIIDLLRDGCIYDCDKCHME
jgi:hypothetical protein